MSRVVMLVMTVARHCYLFIESIVSSRFKSWSMYFKSVCLARLNGGKVPIR